MIINIPHYNKQALIDKIDQCALTNPLRADYKDEDAFNNATHRFLHGTAIAGIILGREGVYGSIKICGVDLSSNIKIFSYDAFRNSELISLFENSLDKENIEDTDISHFSKNGKKIWNSYKRNTLISSASLVQELLSEKEWHDIADVQCRNSKTILVAAAGNDGVNLDDHKNKYYPANLRIKSSCHDFVIRVGSIEYDSKNIPQKADHSNYGSAVDIMAPGKDISVIQPYSRATIGDGTSYAAPIVTATIEMMLKCKPNATVKAVKEALFKSANTYDHLLNFVKDGRVLNVEKAVDSFCKPIPKKKGEMNNTKNNNKEKKNEEL